MKLFLQESQDVAVPARQDEFNVSRLSLALEERVTG